MANYEKVRSLSRIPVSALVRANRFVEVNGVNVREVSVSGGESIGVCLEASANLSQSAISIGLLDGARIPVEAGAAVAAGARIMADTQGRVITATGATARVLGFADEAATEAGQIITVVTSRASGEFTS